MRENLMNYAALLLTNFEVKNIITINNERQIGAKRLELRKTGESLSGLIFPLAINPAQ